MWPLKKNSVDRETPHVRLIDWRRTARDRFDATFDAPEGVVTAALKVRAAPRAKHYTWRPQEGRVAISVPPRTGEAALRRVVQAHAEKFAEAAALASSQEAAMRALWPAPCGGVVKPVYDEREGVWAYGEHRIALSHHYEKSELVAALTALWRDDALAHFEALQARWAQRYGVSSPAVCVRPARGYWGKCYWRRPQIVYSINTYFLSLSFQEYVVAHELAHLFVQDHSPAFWAKLASVLPDARARRQARVPAAGWLL